MYNSPEIIWLYNHSQLDCRYWSEWLFVNNKVFRLINDKAVVPAYSSRPLFVLFTPYELRTYVARLALINEAGDESHIQIEGRGTVNHEVGTERMRNQMPAASCFEEHEIGPDLELSTDHICVRPMSTHSFDSYLFFMKNTTTEHVIQFAWQRLVIWSTMKVMVVPKSGEIEPGEIFPVRVHIHTYRFPAVFNFAVECLYFRKCESEQYFEKSRLVTKVATIFDSSFVLEPDKQVDIAYRNPSLSAKAGKRAKNRIITIGGSVRIFNREFMAAMYPDLNSQLKCCPQQKLNVVSSSKFAGGLCANRWFGATEALQRILWDVVQDKNFQKSLQKERGPIRYIDYPDAGPKRRKIPGRQMAMLLSNLLESALMKLFGVEACLFHDTCKTIEGRRDSREKMLRVFNNYYENMLSTEIDTVCLIAPSANLPRRYQSRDNLAYVQRDT
ncbi:hypothetical protein GE061_018201 [Apolygus lucorum]|uniref:Uncharacterized protein n=1 Tax=Apolygus lucorum TaxID=248454 RepID=A0A8S9XEL4_APOLU|nr:hypothetical protein GE061_018201 [Apolygus lucorum]